MIEIYVKCSSRAYYLDRLIESICRHVTGFRRIVLLNDGIRPEYLGRILDRRPFIEERRSIKLLDPETASRNPAAADPARFWSQEIRRDSARYILLLEEDTWITGAIDLSSLASEIERSHCLMVKMYWCSSDSLLAPLKVFATRVLDGGLALEYYRPHARKLAELYSIFGIAHGVYRSDYWLDAYDGAPYWSQENSILKKAMEFVLRLERERVPYSFCKTKGEMLGQSHSTSARADSGGWWITAKIDWNAYNDALNRAWLEGELDAMEGYPVDIPLATLGRAIENRLGTEAKLKWEQWRDNYVEMYRQMGITI